MTLDEFEAALHKLFDDAVGGGLSIDDVQECAEAIINNTFLDDDAENATPVCVSCGQPATGKCKKAPSGR